MSDIADVTISNHGSIHLFLLNTDAAKKWVKENVNPEPWQMLGSALSVEWRYSSNLLEGMQNDGLLVEVEE